MTTLAELQTELVDLDIKVSVSKDKLIVDAPVGALTPEIKAALKVHKSELISRQHAPGMSDFDALNAIGRIIWDGTSLARVYRAVRQYNEEVRKRK